MVLTASGRVKSFHRGALYKLAGPEVATVGEQS
ncbi:hypothetical protein DNFV4_01383 [Nitrospira tepida]|uniref:Uncharacterized protein n=1 Tax=Nitrospira tepida TaxID=2973512 RepID=A0AA86T3D1_9BACT|nr:hypothetical protein DNFV4_01383 [Nitrospira tepida]